MGIQEERDLIVDRVREQLRRTVHSSRDSQRSVEDRNGFGRGYLSQVLQGHITLSVRHLFGVLLALDSSPSHFFGEVFAEDSSWIDPQELNEIRQKMTHYDAVLAELESLGLITPTKRDTSRQLRK